jgi:hypothetical protein
MHGVEAIWFFLESKNIIREIIKKCRFIYGGFNFISGKIFHKSGNSQFDIGSFQSLRDETHLLFHLNFLKI